jgi:hypothetical protein
MGKPAKISPRINCLLLSYRGCSRIDYMASFGVGSGPLACSFLGPCRQKYYRRSLFENESFEPDVELKGGPAPGPILDYDGVLQF